jgi:hypothetical protein
VCVCGGGGGVAVGPVSRIADPYFLNADPDPAFHAIADLDRALLQSDGNLRPLAYRPFCRALF